MPTKNELFIELLDTIRKCTGKTESEISKSIGRKSNYLAQLKSRFKHGVEVSDKLTDSLKLKFAKELSDVNNPEKYLSSTVPGGIGRLMEKVVSLQASINVLLITVEHISAAQRGMEVGLVSGQIRQAIKNEADRLHGELIKEF